MPSYSEGRDQEDRGSRPLQAKARDPISKIPNKQKKRLMEWLQWYEPEFKLQFHNKKKVTNGQSFKK
jgi:hypothetical protein